MTRFPAKPGCHFGARSYQFVDSVVCEEKCRAPRHRRTDAELPPASRFNSCAGSTSGRL